MKTFRIPAERFHAASDFATYLGSVQKNVELWKGIYRTAVAPPDLVERARRLTSRWHLLALNEDWCGDGVNALPVLSRWVEQVPAIDLRILGREANPDLMDAHRWEGTRSIPVVMILEEGFREVGWWGPRPSVLQRWVRTEGMLLERSERYRHIRQWVARDRGRTTVAEILRIMEVEEGRGPGTPEDSTEAVARP
jgi:Thioredoxin